MMLSLRRGRRGTAHHRIEHHVGRRATGTGRNHSGPRGTLRSIAPLAMLAVVACTQAQLDRAEAYRAQVAQSCGVLSVIAPGTWAEPWVADCRTAAGIAKLALDPMIHAWLQGIIARLR